MNQKERRLIVASLFIIGILQIAGFWLSGALVNGDGPLAIPQPDTPLYLQSARRVAEGFPFSFSDGSAISTGSTTVLHPFIFAIPFLLGIDGDTAIACSFVINAVFYLVFLLSWGVVIRRWIEDPIAQVLAAVMLAMFGQTAYAALALSDIGLWLAVSGLFMAGLASGRKWLYGSMLILGPWIRPEGMVVAIAFFMIVLGTRIVNKDKLSCADKCLAIAGILSILGVFGLNLVLTGKMQFASVATKGHFATRPFFAAIYCSMTDLSRMCSSFFFGITNDPLRQFYMLPVLGALTFWIGVVNHHWNDWRKFVFPLACAGGIWTVATSGWQNTNVDRYVAWIMPIIVIFSAVGFTWLYHRLSSCRAAVVILILPVLFAMGAMAAFWSLFNSASHKSDWQMKFGHALAEALPAKATIGTAGFCNLAYPLKNHGVRALYGIYSPEFEGPLLACTLETLKNQPATRFDYWVFTEETDLIPAIDKLQGEILMVGPNDTTVRKADWTAFDHAAEVPASRAGGRTLKQRVDVGYLADEKLAGYEAETRFGLPALEVFQHVADLNGAKAYDAGRAIWGLDSMYVALEPGKDVLVVMRTLREKDADIPDALGENKKRHYDFGASPSLNIAVDDKVCATVKYDIPNSDFADVVFMIPGSAIVNPVSRIAFLGDHITCGYWFFQ